MNNCCFVGKANRQRFMAAIQGDRTAIQDSTQGRGGDVHRASHKTAGSGEEVVGSATRSMQ